MENLQSFQSLENESLFVRENEIRVDCICVDYTGQTDLVFST